ncbi:MAG: hypothetical protein ACRDN0_40185, partial [Trebonia sp.]
MGDVRPNVSYELLPDWDDRLPWQRSFGPIICDVILRGSQETELVVVSAHSTVPPTKADLRTAWRARSGGGVTPVLLTVRYPVGSGWRAVILGLTEDAVPVADVDARAAEQLIQDALLTDSPSGLYAEVRRRLAALGGAASGIRSEG